MVLFAVLLLFLFLSLQPNSTVGNITLSSSLTTKENSIWPSDSGDFAFGFRQLNNSNLYLLAIWFNKIPDRTIIWYANGGNPAPEGSKVELTASNLVLSDPKGLTIWEATPATGISSASMLDTGNFVLAGNTSGYLWESFKNSTDTILPTQTMDLGGMLSSRLTETNFSKGRFELHFSNGSLKLNPTAWPSEVQYDPYYTSQTYDVNPSQSGNQLVFNESAKLYIVKANGDIAQLPSWGTVNYSAGYYYRATLGTDGVFTLYSHPKNSSTNQGWLSLLYVPPNICSAFQTNDIGSGACGFNSYCLVQENRRPTCDCPPGYVFLDPNNRFGGCKPTFPQGCGLDDESSNPEDLYDIRRFENVNWPRNDYELLAPYNETQCQKACLYDCSCAVAVFNGNQCWKKRLPLSNGWYITSGYSKVLFKVRKEVPPSGYSDFRGNNDNSNVLLKALLGSSAFANACLLLVTCLVMFRWKHKRRMVKEVHRSSDSATNLPFFTYKDIEDATDGFREELGRGSFGIVYRGILRYASRAVPIAVKKLDKLAKDREQEFRTEVTAIGKTHHRNLVQLLGYCDEGSHRLLIYEFMSNGTLASFLFTSPKPDWNHRVKIAMGISRGLLYLHEECDVPIIHCDIKPQNILLDDYLRARISDFGLAKLLLSDQTRTKTMIRGTRGYVAPEWFKNVPITAKVDVYSFGVMLLEIICCRRSVAMEEEAEERAILTDWAYDCYVGRRFDLLVENDTVAMDDKDRLQRWVSIAMWCIQEDPSRRPTAKLVMAMLEGFVEVPLLTYAPFSFSSSFEVKSSGD